MYTADRQHFIEMMKVSDDLQGILKYFHENFYGAAAAFKQKMHERLIITHFIRRSLLEMTRSMWAKIAELEANRA